MATTKKVALDGGTSKKAAPKAASSLSKKVTKKPTLQTPKKTIKKESAKKTAVKKSKLTIVKKAAPKKKLEKSIAAEVPISFEEKLNTSALLRPQKTKVKKTEKIKVVSKKTTTRISKVTVPLALSAFVPFRLPVSLDVYAIQTARFSGVFFVAIGAFLTLYLSQYIWDTPIDSMQSVATVVSSTGEEEITTTSSDTNKQPNLEPPVSFSTSITEPLHGQVEVFFAVDDAQSVNVLVFKESYVDPIYLGEAKKRSDGSWYFVWDTTRFADGNYKFAVDVTNVISTKMYRNADATYLQVQNTAPGTVEVVTIFENSLDTESVVDTNPTVDFKIAAYVPDTKKVFLTLSVADATEIKLYAQHTESGSENFLGYAYLDSGILWKYRWDTSKYTDGAYDIKARVSNAFGSYTGGKVSVTVQNTSTEDSLVLTEETPTITSENLAEVPKEIAEPPTVHLSIPGGGSLTGIKDIRIDTADAISVELYAIQIGSKTEKYIGRAKVVDTDRWTLRLDTTQIPNAQYTLLARVKNAYGSYESNTVSVTIYNKPLEIVLSPVQEDALDQIDTAKKIEDSVTAEDFDTTEAAFAELIADADETSEDVPVVVDDVAVILNQFKSEIDAELERFIAAYRSKDLVAIEKAEVRITKLTAEITGTLNLDNSTQLTADIAARIDTIVSNNKVLTDKIEKIIVERVGVDVFKDSDNDGLSDYDERTLYGTDPFSADTDGDGFIDGVEVENGFDPRDAVKEVAITYESPQDMGIVREDILEVHDVRTLVIDDETTVTESTQPLALIRGKALPNSFVTLYVFSTPIIVTLKTEADGSWQYRFDKELEDGAHSVYVGVTDNAGRIIAKSQPFAFIKEAQAFSPVDASVVGSVAIQEPANSLVSDYMILLILSISVVSIGLVLILLGLHLDTRQRRLEVVTEDTPA